MAERSLLFEISAICRAQANARRRATVADLVASGFTELLVPAHYGGQQADFPAILDPVRRMAHGRDVDVLAGHVVSTMTPAVSSPGRSHWV